MHYKTEWRGEGGGGNLTKVRTTHPSQFTPPPPFKEALALLTTYLEFYNLEEQDRDIKRITNVS